MSADREQILSNVRRSLARGRGLGVPPTPSVQDQKRARLLPERGRADAKKRVEMFVAMAEEAACTVASLSAMAEVPAAVARYSRSHQPAPEVVLTPAPDITDLPWDADTGLSIRVGRADGDTEIGVTIAFAGIAETGTLMLISGAATPTSLNFLPALHVVVLSESRIVGAYEDAWDLLGCELGQMPRTVNFITGPSRSGDIGQTLHMGAHGPLEVHILLIREGPAALRSSSEKEG